MSGNTLGKLFCVTSFGESLDGATLYAVSAAGTIYRFAR